MVDFRGYFQQDEGEDEREDYQRHHLGGDGGKCFHEWDFGFRAHEGEEYRGKNGDGDVGDDGECGQAWDASSKHSGDNRGCRGGWAEDADECALGEVGAEWQEGEVESHCAYDLHREQSPREGGDAEFTRPDTAECDEKHDENQVGGDEFYFPHEVMKDDSGQHGNRQHPRLEPLAQK